jgi:hypothetical protein
VIRGLRGRSACVILIAALLTALGFSTGITAASANTSQQTPIYAVPNGWQSLGSGTTSGYHYVAFQLDRKPAIGVTTVRFWPSFFDFALTKDDASQLGDQFDSSAYLMVISTSHDPFPGRVSPLLSASSATIRRAWVLGHHLLLVGYFGKSAPRNAGAQADEIGRSASATTNPPTGPTTYSPLNGSILGCGGKFAPGTSVKLGVAVGMTLVHFQRFAMKHNETVRVVGQDGLCNGTISDLERGRVDVVIVDGKIVKAVIEV